MERITRLRELWILGMAFVRIKHEAKSSTIIRKNICNALKKQG
jgi:hypothetical protein